MVLVAVQWRNLGVKYREIQFGGFKMQEMTIGEWLDQWFEVYTEDLAESTVAIYRDARRRVSKDYPELEQMNLASLTPIKFQSILNKLGKKYAKSTLNHIKVLYNKLYHAAIENHLCEWNPIHATTIPKYASQKIVNALPEDQQRKFEEAASKLPVVDHFAILTLLFTGLRRDELRRLTWDDWDKERHILSIRKSKTKNGVRNVPLIPEVTVMFVHLSHRAEAKHSPFIFSSNGKQLTYGHMRYICKKAAKLAGINHVTPHILRHSFATRMIEQGADPKSLSMIIGHANVAFTLQRYVTVDQSHLADQMMLLSNSHKEKERR